MPRRKKEIASNIEITGKEPPLMDVKCLMNLIGSIQEFQGEVKELSLFLERMDAIHSQIIDSNFDELTTTNLHSFFLSRISTSIMVDLGVSFSSSWEDVKKALKERYAGARKSVSAMAMRVLELNRDLGESIGSFANRLSQLVKELKSKVLDSCNTKEEGVWRNKIYEELSMEVLLRAASERVCTSVKIAKPQSLEETIQIVKDEESYWKEASHRHSNWRVVENKRRYSLNSRTSPVYGNRSNQKWRTDVKGLVTNGKGNRKEREGKLARNECWECREEGHFARECPYIYRKEVTPKKNFGRREVNALRRKENRKKNLEGSSDGESLTHSSDSENSCYRYESQYREKNEKDWPELKENKSTKLSTKKGRNKD